MAACGFLSVAARGHAPGVPVVCCAARLVLLGIHLHGADGLPLRRRQHRRCQPHPDQGAKGSAPAKGGVLRRVSEWVG